MFAQMATEILLDGPLTTAEGDLDPDVGNALNYRVEIYQAQGMLSVRLGVGLAEALARMRAYAFGQGRTLIELAHEIIGGRSFVEGEI
jgi:AmiR/NasT family two-component response regulator